MMKKRLILAFLAGILFVVLVAAVIVFICI